MKTKTKKKVTPPSKKAKAKPQDIQAFLEKMRKAAEVNGWYMVASIVPAKETECRGLLHGPSRALMGMTTGLASQIAQGIHAQSIGE